MAAPRPTPVQTKWSDTPSGAGSVQKFKWSDTPSDSGSDHPLAAGGTQAADVPPGALAAAASAAAAVSSHRPRRARATAGGKGGAIIGRIGSMLVYVETEAKNTYEPFKVWVVETSAKVRGALEARAGPAAQRLQAAGQPLVVYVTPICARVTNGVLGVRSAAGGTAIAVKSRAMQLKGESVGRALAAYGAACEFAGVRCRAACGLAEARVAPIRARVLELYGAGRAKALPYHVKATDSAVLCCQKVRDGAHYVETRVGDVVLRIRLGAGDRATLVRSAVLSRYAAVSDFVGGYTGPVAAKLAAMYEAVVAHVSSRLSPIVARALEGKAFVFTKACGIAVVVKVRSLAVKDRAAQYKDRAVQCPSALLVQVKDGYVYMKKTVDGRVVVVKARLADVLAGLSSALLQVKGQARLRAANALDTAHVKYLALRAEVKRIAVDPSARATAASAAGGATVMGAGGGAAGLVAGGTFGAACGVPFSLFTLGLSIPVGAAVGSAAGLCAGAAAGGTAGLVGGGAAGHKIHQNKGSIAEGFGAAAAKAGDIRGMAAAKASAYKTKVADSTAATASYVRSRFAGGTGGTDEDR